MTPGEMRKRMSELLLELANHIDNPRGQCRANAILVQISLWAAAAEICDRLDRLIAKGESDGE